MCDSTGIALSTGEAGDLPSRATPALMLELLGATSIARPIMAVMPHKVSVTSE